MDREHLNGGRGGIRVNWTAASALFLVIVQLIAFVAFITTEHASRIEDEHRFSDFVTFRANQLVELRKLYDDKLQDLRRDEESKNAQQDLIINHIDEVGSRGMAVVVERQQNNSRRIEALERAINDMNARADVNRSIASQAVDIARETQFKVKNIEEYLNRRREGPPPTLFRPAPVCKGDDCPPPP